MDLQKRSESLVKAKKSLVDKTAADKLHKAGKFTAYELIGQLFDEGTFVETNAYVKAYANELGTANTAEYEGVVCGYGAVDGRLTFVYAQNAARLNGAFSKAAAEKIA
ncbi:MAG: methylmalonyl-CoA carboxyltransferase, partial [Clostridia bacterium]|nr:methylmalonyl-CoA carboxyltransferase [Clostridia bacterium]